MSQRKPLGITGPAAAMVDVLFLVLIFLVAMLVMRPPELRYVLLPEAQTGTTLTADARDIFVLTLTPEGFTHSGSLEPITIEQVIEHLTGALIYNPDLETALCITGVPFQQHWPLVKMIQDLSPRTVGYLPCDEKELQ